MTVKKIAGILALSLISLSSLAQSIAPFKDGERVVAFGDSITEGGHYHSYLWLYYATHFPYMKISVQQAGIGGDTVGMMDRRLETDVLDKKPTCLTVMFGMNDTGYFEYFGENWKEYGEKRLAECQENYLSLEKKLKGLEDVHIVMLSSTPYDEGAHFEKPEDKGRTDIFNGEPFPHKNDVMKEVAGMQEKSAAANGWDYLDLNTPMLAAAKRMQEKDSAYTISGGDRIHPDNAGHMLVLCEFLRAQGLSGKPVADFAVDARGRKTLKQENCEISNIEGNARELSFDYLAESLPFPLDTICRGNAGHPQSHIKQLMPSFMEEFNREMLSVKGLKGNYKLEIDDVELGTWTGEQLASGINLAELSWTPQYQQALDVMHLNEMRYEIEVTFRYYAFCQYDFMLEKGLLNACDQKAQKAIEEGKKDNMFLSWHYVDYDRLMHKGFRESRIREMKFLADEMYRLNKPVSHRISLRKI